MLGFGCLCIAFLSLSLTAAKPWPVQKYKSQDFTAPGFKVKRSGASTADGLLFLGYFKTQPKLEAPMIFQDNGQLVWHGPTGGPVYNFRRQVLNGKIVLTYWTGYLDYQGHGYGQVKILDKQYNQLYNLCLPPSENNNINSPRKNQYPGNIQNPCYVDKHESLITGNGTILLTVYNATQTDLTAVGGASDGWVFDCIFYEMDVTTQEILFKWSALDHVDVADSHFVNNTQGAEKLQLNGHLYGTADQPWDYFHINSVQKVDGGYILNSRMTWAFYMVNNSGEKIWTLEGSNGGDFTLGSGISWSWQHMPRLDVDTSTNNVLQISFFNNDNIPHLDQGQETSTGYLLEVNLNTMHVEALKDLRPATPLYGVAEGSYQVLDQDHALVGYGAVPVVQEFVGGKRIYSAQFAKNDGGAHSYRAYRFPWSSQPNTSPSAAASITSAAPNTVNAYMSWNGATTYSGWRVYAGTTAADLSVVASNVPKSGFETTTSFALGNNGYQFVMVEALSGSKSLGNSSAVRIKS